MVRDYRRQLSLVLLGVEKTANNVHETKCILHPPPETEGYKGLQSMLGKLQRIDYIQPDGNCFFRAVSKEVLGHEKFHYLIRQILIQFIKENARVFQKYLFEGTLEAHCKKMECIGCWGTQVEINAAATLLKTSIYVFSRQSNIKKTYEWMCYQPSRENYTVHQCSSEIKKIIRLQPPKGCHIELIHSFECHFDRVAPSNLSLTSMENAPTLKSPSSLPSSIIVLN